MPAYATLPRLAPESSAIMLRVTHPPPTPPKAQQRTLQELNTQSVYTTYPPPLPLGAPLPQKVNPLKPPHPERRTISLETGEAHWQNEKRRDIMVRRDHHRYHNAWSRYYYGNMAEKELYRRYIREGLKQQMDQYDENRRTELKNKVRESEIAVERDNVDVRNDKKSVSDKHQYLTQYRDANKEIMEMKEEQRRSQKRNVDIYDREQLKYNPINWSGTLK